jgi:hypothetical protein
MGQPEPALLDKNNLLEPVDRSKGPLRQGGNRETMRKMPASKNTQHTTKDATKEATRAVRGSYQARDPTFSIQSL